jgi:hypothetical protein
LSGDRRPLNSEQIATLRQLRREVDDLQDEMARTTGTQPNTQSRLFYARDRLAAFTKDLRAQGYLI